MKILSYRKQGMKSNFNNRDITHRCWIIHSHSAPCYDGLSNFWPNKQAASESSTISSNSEDRYTQARNNLLQRK